VDSTDELFHVLVSFVLFVLLAGAEKRRYRRPIEQEQEETESNRNLRKIGKLVNHRPLISGSFVGRYKKEENLRSAHQWKVRLMNWFCFFSFYLISRLPFFIGRY